MLDRQTAPLEIARKVLKPETIRDVRSGGFGNSAYLILDRWALNSPNMLKKLEKEGAFALTIRLDQQQTLEARTLTTEEARQASLRGMSDWEILELAGVDTELRTIE
jgi:hypothetical protein